MPRRKNTMVERFQRFLISFPGVVRLSIIKDKFMNVGVAFTGKKKEVAYFVPLKTCRNGYVAVSQMIMNEAVKNRRKIVVDLEGQYMYFDARAISQSRVYTTVYRKLKFTHFQIALGYTLNSSKAPDEPKLPMKLPDHPTIHALHEHFNLTHMSVDQGETWHPVEGASAN